jgi:hypothetical protein
MLHQCPRGVPVRCNGLLDGAPRIGDLGLGIAALLTFFMTILEKGKPKAIDSRFMNPMKEFTVQGPFDVPLEPNKGGKMVARDLEALWLGVGDARGKKGVYVFAIRAGKGYTPIYVGKTDAQTFESETFTKRNRADHYNPALLDYRKGQPVLFLIIHPEGKGAINKTCIDGIETFVIDIASIKNGDLSNVRKRKQHRWRIKGVVRAHKGEGKSAPAQELRRAIGL